MARLRQIPQHHGTGVLPAIYAELARQLYVPHLGPDFAYVHWTDFYELSTFQAAYDIAVEKTQGFTRVSVEDLTQSLAEEPASGADGSYKD